MRNLVRSEINQIYNNEDYIMKTLNKNLFTSGLAIAMVCAMALPAFADNSNSNFFVPQSVEAIIEHNERGNLLRMPLA